MGQPLILFLDIDEVLWFTRVNMALPGSDGIDPVSAGMLRRICEQTGAKIVVTSTWRCSPERCQAMFDKYRLTSHLWSPIGNPADDWRVEAQNASRTAAILNWLKDHPEISMWTIFDDSRQDFDEQMLGHLVHVNALYGIGIHEYRRAMKLYGIDDGKGPSVAPRYTIANLASDAVTALEQGDEASARSILETIRNMPLAQ